MRSRGRHPDITVRLYPRGWEEPSPLKLPKSARMIRAGGRKVFVDGEKFFIDFHENAFFVIEGDVAEGVCYGDERLDPFFWTELSISYIVTILLRRKNRFLLHAGGAVAPSGTGFLFLGPSGSGKSTAAMRLASEGWKYLGDDVVYVDKNYRVHSYPKRAAATDWTVKRLGIEDRVILRRATGKNVIKPWEPAQPVADYEIFRPLPATTAANAFVRLDDAEEILRSQMTLCETDAIIGGPLPDLRLLVARLREIRIGDLDGLPKSLIRE